MTTGHPPTPRSGQLMAGGANSLELVWALAALVVVAIVAVVSAIAWLALWIEAQLTGTLWSVSVLAMPAVLVDVANGASPEVSAVVAPP